MLVIGGIATAIDYMTLNVLVVMFAVVPVFANVAASALGSYYSYRLNKTLTYQGRMHDPKRTLIIYFSIVISGIALFQVGLFYLINSVFDAPTEYALGIIDASISELSFNESIMRLNIAKVFATVGAGLWSYLMMRRFVYATSSSERHESDD